MKLIFGLFLTVITAVVPLYASAHATGTSLERVVNGYRFDIGYSPADVAVGTQTRLDFLLFDEESGKPIPFSDVWVRLTKESKAYFAGGISQPEFGAAGILYSFPEAGEYELSVRFQNDGESIAEETFTLPVLPPEEGTRSTSTTTILLYIVGALIIGALIGFLAGRSRG